MARENRSANRAAASAAEAAKPALGSDFSDIVEQSETAEDEPEFAFEEEQEQEEDELPSESLRAAPEGSDKEGDEDKVAEEVAVDQTEDEAAAGEVATGEKPAVEKPEVEEKTAAEPTTEEPAPAAEVAKAAEKPIALPSEENLSDEQAAELFSNWRTTTEDLLAKHHYKLSEDDVDAFNENPAEFIPRYASRVYLDSISAAFQQFVTYLPRMVDQVIEQRSVSTRNEDTFFGRWPELVNDKAVVARLGKAYRMENPSASVEDFINEVGAQAMVALRKVPLAAAAAAAPNGKTKAFKPASNGPANARMEQRKPANQWERLTEEFGTEDISEEDL